MLHNMRLCLLSLIGLSFGAAQAATITVNQSGGADHTDLLTAIYAANSGDTVLIQDSATYSGSFPSIWSGGNIQTAGYTLTIEVAPGQTPVFETGTPIFFNPVNGGSLTIRGASDAARFTIRDLDPNPVIMFANGGTGYDCSAALTLENVNVERPDTDADSWRWYTWLETSAPVNWTNVTFLGGISGVGGNAEVIRLRPGSDASFTNCDFRVDNDFMTMTFGSNPNGASGNVTFTDCIFGVGAFDAPIRGIRESAGGDYTGTMTFNDCQFEWGAGTDTIISFLTGNAATFVFKNPVANGIVSVNGAAFLLASTTDVNLEIKGNGPTDKFDFATLYGVGGASHLADIRNGTLKLTDCAFSITEANRYLVTADGAEQAGNVTIQLDRCEISGNGGIRASATGGAFAYNVEALNTIFLSPAGGGPLIDTSGDHTGASSIELTHCTFVGPNTSEFITANQSRAGAALGSPRDTLTANYCIFDTAGGSLASNDFTGANLAGADNILAAAGDFNGAEPTGFVAAIGDPNLDATGHVTTTSAIADRAAVGSTATIDVDGDPRPMLGTVPDIGADEASTLPVELSDFSGE